MFKVMTCPETGISLVYKKLFGFWVKWTIFKSNMATNIPNTLSLIKCGTYCFLSPRNTFFWIVDSTAIVRYYDDVNDFLHKNAEDLI